MIEAAMVLPLVILIIFSLFLIMLHDYQCYQEQIAIHEAMLSSWDSPKAVFDIQKKKTETSSIISGAVDLLFETEKEYQCYRFSPAVCIRLGEMISFVDEE